MLVFFDMSAATSDLPQSDEGGPAQSDAQGGYAARWAEPTSPVCLPWREEGELCVSAARCDIRGACSVS